MEITFEIGNELLAGDSVQALIDAFIAQPTTAMETLIASVTDTLEKRPDPAGVSEALQKLRAAATWLDQQGGC